jgi:hypothetical protein
MFTVQKRDHACLWFRHLPDAINRVLEPTPAGARTPLIVNGQLTAWERMRPGLGRPTPGVRIVEGRAFWNVIAIGDAFRLELPDGEPPVSIQVVEPETPLPRSRVGTTCFDVYAIADYSGAADRTQQKRAIRLAIARGAGVPAISPETFTRDALVRRQLVLLREATNHGLRAVLGQDHQYSLPIALLEEIGLAGLDWREVLRRLVRGAYGRGGPPLAHARTFAAAFNVMLVRMGRPEYFWSATKGMRYGIPTANPRPGDIASAYRLTERSPSISGRGSPKPFSRVGDNGSVAGQTLVGLIQLFELLRACEADHIPLRCWPMDGLDVESAAYLGAHVLMEPYPSAARLMEVPQTDANDALAAARLLQQADREGKLTSLLDLSGLCAGECARVEVEGWIVGHEPHAVVGG